MYHELNLSYTLGVGPEATVGRGLGHILVPAVVLHGHEGGGLHGKVIFTSLLLFKQGVSTAIQVVDLLTTGGLSISGTLSCYGKPYLLCSLLHLCAYV